MTTARTALLFTGFLLTAAPAIADLKPDIIECDAGKAARNAAMEAAVGVHGRCDADRLADKTKDKGKDKLDDAKENASDHVDDALNKHDDKDHKLLKHD